MKLIVLVACALLGGTIISCSVLPSGTSEDSWYTGQPQGEQPCQEWSELDASRIHEVMAALEAEAEALLEQAASVHITAQQAAEFVGQTLPDVPGTEFYLTRSIYLSRATGRSSVYTCGDWLHISHGSLGSGGYRQRRQALVLQLDVRPRRVFVSCVMAR